MAYSTSLPPTLVAQRIGNGPALWIYKSVDDDATTNGAGYYTDGVKLGMRQGDFVLVFDTTTPKGSFHYVASVSGDAATTAFGAVA